MLSFPATGENNGYMIISIKKLIKACFFEITWVYIQFINFAFHDFRQTLTFPAAPLYAIDYNAGTVKLGAITRSDNTTS